MTEIYLAILIILGVLAIPLAVSLILLVCDLKPDRKLKAHKGKDE